MHHYPEIRIGKLQNLADRGGVEVFHFAQRENTRNALRELAKAALKRRSELGLFDRGFRRNLPIHGHKIVTPVVFPAAVRLKELVNVADFRSILGNRAFAGRSSEMIDDLVFKNSRQPRPLGRPAGVGTDRLDRRQ